MADGGVDDRTFKVELGNSDSSNNNITVRYEYDNGSVQSINKTVKALTENVVKLHINILKLANGTPVVDPGIVATYVTAANEIYAQVGIRIELAGEMNVVDQPAGVNLANGLDEFQGVDANGKLLMTNEEKALLDNYSTAPINGNADDIEVYFVNYFAPQPGSYAEAFRVSSVPEAKYADSLVCTSAIPYVVLGHEIGHVLTDDGSHPDGDVGVNRVNLMAFPYQVSGLVTDSKRISTAQSLLMNSVRPNLLITP